MRGGKKKAKGGEEAAKATKGLPRCVQRRGQHAAGVAAAEVCECVSQHKGSANGLTTFWRNRRQQAISGVAWLAAAM